MLAEAFADKWKTSKYYYRVTLFVYESVAFLSFLSLILPSINVWSPETLSTALQTTSCTTIILVLMELLCSFMSKHILCLFWIKNTFVHIKLIYYDFLHVSERLTLHIFSIIETKLWAQWFLTAFRLYQIDFHTTCMRIFRGF